jgi:putative transposase
VTQRGNNRADVFFTAADRKCYVLTLARCCQEFKLKVWAYCLMSNHVHIVAVPEQDYSLAQGIGRTNLIYTQYVNREYRRTGRLWQNRFLSTPADSDRHLWTVCRYVEANPVRAKLVEHAWNYRWSSARHHVNSAPDPLVGESPWFDPAQCDDYRQYLDERSNREEIERIRRSTRTGRPLGDPDFVGKLEVKLGRILRPGKRGPKPGE